MSGEELRGRELDAEVVSKVMGEAPTRGMWCPSRHITDAMDVIEKVVADGWQVAISTDIEYAKHAWYVSFFKTESDFFHEGNGDCDSLPEAVCRAALEACASTQDTSSSEAREHTSDTASVA